MADIVWDDKDFKAGMGKFLNRVQDTQIKALGNIADELLRLSQLEVPFKTGHLMQTGNTERDNDEYLVGYNTPYAARVHEHPEFRFGNGRKGKYLEDPMKKNLSVFRDHFNQAMGAVF